MLNNLFFHRDEQINDDNPSSETIEWFESDMDKFQLIFNIEKTFLLKLVANGFKKVSSVFFDDNYVSKDDMLIEPRLLARRNEYKSIDSSNVGAAVKQIEEIFFKLCATLTQTTSEAKSLDIYQNQVYNEQLIIDEILISPNLYVAEYFSQLKSEIDSYFVNQIIYYKNQYDSLTCDSTTLKNEIDMYLDEYKRNCTSSLSSSLSSFTVLTKALKYFYAKQKYEKRWLQFIEIVAEFEKQTRPLTNIELNNLKKSKKTLVEIENIIFRNKCIMFGNFNLIEDIDYKLVIIADCFVSKNVALNSFVHMNGFYNLYDKSRHVFIVNFSKIVKMDSKEVAYKYKLPSSCSFNSFCGIFFNMKMLTHLDLSWNKIVYLLPNTFDGLFNLKWLNLSDNNLVQITDTYFAKLKNLQYLNLHCNQICWINIKSFDSLKKLRTCILSRNNLFKLPNALFHNCVLLQFLDLSKNLFTNLDADWLCKATELRVFSCSKCFLLTMDLDCFENAIRLKILRLDNSYISVFRNYQFNKLSRLDYLYLQNTNKIFVSFKPNCFDGLVNLRTLDLSFTRINTLNTHIFNPCVVLKKIIIVDLRPYVMQFLLSTFNDSKFIDHFLLCLDNKSVRVLRNPPHRVKCNPNQYFPFRSL